MKIGFVSLPVTGHINPMTALARALNRRGHEAFFFGVPDIESVVRAAGVSFVPYGEREFPKGSIPELYAPLSQLRGLEVARYAFEKCSPGLTQAAFDYLPQKLKENNIECMAIDTAHSFVQLAPMSIGIPFAHIWNILPFDFSGTTPINLYSWPNDPGPEARSRNMEGLRPLGEMVGHVASLAIPYAEEVGLKIDWSDPTSLDSKLATISQTPEEFDFPDIPWPSSFHYTGPFHLDEGRQAIPFPWEKLTEQPLIYASLGTLVNGLGYIYKSILEAAESLPDVQIVLSVGNNIKFEDLGTIPPNALVVRSAPQLDLLKRASLCITHAGLNTALESLAQGVPMVAVPIAFDQPGVAARISSHGLGEFVDSEGVTTERLQQLISTVLHDPAYRGKARFFRELIEETDGLNLAVNHLEEAFRV